jgi:hypothetical protein
MGADITFEVVGKHRHPLYGKACSMPTCGKPFLVGDTVICVDKGRGVYVDRESLFHRRCLLAFVLSTPLEKPVVESEIERIRQGGSTVSELLGVE